MRFVKKKMDVTCLAVVCTFVFLTGTAHGSHVELIDSCVGVDHPEFEREYPGDGYSYLNVGLTVPLQHFGEAAVVGLLEGGDGQTAEAEGVIDANGRVFLSFPLYSYGDYKITVSGEDGHPVYEETISVGAGEPQCDPESLASSPPAEQAPDGDEEAATEPEAAEEVPSDPESPAEVESPTEPASPAEADASADTESPTGTEISTETGEDGANDRPWWPFVVIGLGIAAAAGGLFLIGKRPLEKRPCEELRRKWEAAERLAKEARETAERAREAEKQAADSRVELEAELAEIRSAYPSAGKPGGDEAWVESDGKRIRSRDLAMRREAEQAAWNKYRQNPTPETAAELEEAWNQAAEPSSDAERRELDERARQLEQELDTARQAESDARAAAEAAGQAAEQAVGRAEAARRAYEECIGRANASGGSGGQTADGDGSGGGVATTTKQGEGSQTRECRCREDEPPQERNRRELGVVTFPVRLDVELHGGHAHEAAKEAKEISEQLADASEKLGWLSTAMDLKGIGTSLVRDGSGWKVLGASAAPIASKALDVPIPTSPGQAVVDVLSLGAKIASVIVGKVPELQARRLPDCDISVAVVTRTLSATCSEIWVCQDGQWVQKEHRFALTVVREGRSGSRKYEALTWDQAQSTIERFENIQMNQLQNALNEIARLEARCGSS